MGIFKTWCTLANMLLNIIIISNIIFFTGADLVSELNQCLENRETVDCLKLVVGSLKQYMKTGIPEANLPPLDPLNLDNVGFSLAGAKVEFMNIFMEGLSNHTVKDVQYDDNTRIMTIELGIAKLKSTGDYALSGKVFNIEGLDSTGPYRNEYNGITAYGEGNIILNGGKIEIGEMNIKLKINKIKVHMECLFPKPGGPQCCDADKKFRSCNKILAKTIHRTINNQSGGTSSIVERFQDEITGKVAEITKQFLNSALSKVDPGKFF